MVMATRDFTKILIFRRSKGLIQILRFSIYFPLDPLCVHCNVIGQTSFTYDRSNYKIRVSSQISLVPSAKPFYRMESKSFLIGSMTLPPCVARENQPLKVHSPNPAQPTCHPRAGEG